MFKKSTHLLLALGFGVIVLLSFSNIAGFFATLENSLRDSMFLLRGSAETSGNIVIIDMDEKLENSLENQSLSRDKLAEIIYYLAQADAKIIGVDMMFKGLDPNSPAKIYLEKGLEVPSDIEDYDYTLAATIANTPTVGGYKFDTQNEGNNSVDASGYSKVLIEFSNNINTVDAKKIDISIPLIQENYYSSGFYNFNLDTDGIVRTLPLTIKYGASELHPAFSLNIYRLALGLESLTVLSTNGGEIYGLEVGEQIVPIGDLSQFYINYRGKSHTFEYISASDVLNNTFNKDSIANKLVLIGSSNNKQSLFSTPYDSNMPSVEIHANIIDTL